MQTTMSMSRTRPSRHASILALLALPVLASWMPAPVFAQSSSGTTSGKQSAFVRYTDILVLPSGTVNIGTVNLEKGKKKRNLVVDVTISYSNNTELTHPTFSVEVNDIAVPPFSWLFTCPANTQCLNSMTWWVDLDVLEAANPGQIISQPLTVELLLGAEVPFPTTSSQLIAQMGARLQPK